MVSYRDMDQCSKEQVSGFAQNDNASAERRSKNVKAAWDYRDVTQGPSTQFGVASLRSG
jgi:hypothetical protein